MPQKDASSHSSVIPLGVLIPCSRSSSSSISLRRSSALAWLCEASSSSCSRFCTSFGSRRSCLRNSSARSRFDAKEESEIRCSSSSVRWSRALAFVWFCEAFSSSRARSSTASACNARCLCSWSTRWRGASAAWDNFNHSEVEWGRRSRNSFCRRRAASFSSVGAGFLRNFTTWLGTRLGRSAVEVTLGVDDGTNAVIGLRRFLAIPGRVNVRCSSDSPPLPLSCSPSGAGDSNFGGTGTSSFFADVFGGPCDLVAAPNCCRSSSKLFLLPSVWTLGAPALSTWMLPRDAKKTMARMFVVEYFMLVKLLMIVDVREETAVGLLL